MKILETKFVQGFIKMANDGYLQGWHERNGGEQWQMMRVL